MTEYSRNALIAMLVILSILDIKTRNIPNWIMILCLLTGFLLIRSGYYALRVGVGFTFFFFMSLLNLPCVGRFGGGDLKVASLIFGVMGTHSGLLVSGVAILSSFIYKFITFENKIAFVPHLLVGVLVCS